MILLTGLAHSHTSATAKFLKDNGGCFRKHESNWSEELPYDKYEDYDVLEWVKDRKWFVRKPFPVKEGISKAPDAMLFVDQIPLEVKIVFCMRHVGDLTFSHMEKNSIKFYQALNTVLYANRKALNAEHDVFFLPTERLLGGDERLARRLLDFCELNPLEIKHDLQPLKKHGGSYPMYRLKNLIWKLIS